MSDDSAPAKPWYRSIAVWGGIFAILPLLGVTGLQFDPTTGDFSGNIYQLWASITAAGGGVAATIGRIRAKARIGK
jgi:hypothetical protein